MSSFSKDNQKLHVSLISQFITQHLSPAIGLFVLLRLILFISNPLWLISSVSAGIRCMLINSWKAFQEFINIHLIPALTEEINQRGFEINSINLNNTNRPIAGDKCWVINCEIKDTCNFWLSFEKDDISSLKSISLSKPNQKPSIIESFLIDEKRITLKLIISRVLQRLNGQKLIGVN